MDLLSNVFQEIWEAFSKGSAFVQTFGLTVGIIVFVLLILRPILNAVRESSSGSSSYSERPISNTSTDSRIGKKDTSETILSEYLKFCNWLIDLQYLATTDNSNLIQEFCSIRYKANKCFVFFTNTSLGKKDFKLIITVFSKYKVTKGIILCKQLQSDDAEIIQAFDEIKAKFPERAIISKTDIHCCFDSSTFSPMTFIELLGPSLSEHDWGNFKKIKFKDEQGKLIDPFTLQ